MNADLNHEIRDRLSRNKKRRNRRRLLLVLCLMAVLVTSTVLASPATALTEDTSEEVVQNMQAGASAAAPADSLPDEDQSAGEAQNQTDAQNSMQAENMSAPQDDSQNGAQTAGQAAEQRTEQGASRTDAQSVDLNTAARTDENVDPDAAARTDENADPNAALENTTAEADAADSEEEITENAGGEEAATQAELAFEDSRMRIAAVRADGNAFPAGMTLSAEAFDDSDSAAAERLLRDLVSQNDTDSTTFSIAGFHALQLAPENEDGSDAYVDGEIRFTAEFTDGLNDAGYASKEE